jgi:AcrR family transcriptional regulator
MAKQQTRQKILDEALDLLGEEGFSGLTLGTLASRSGLSKSGLFAHFKSKADLEAQVIDQSLERGQISFIEAAMQKPEGLPRLSTFFEGWIGWTAKAGLKAAVPLPQDYSN